LAALIAIPYSYHSPQSYIDTNITGTYNILKSSQKNNISKIIITSTSEVYGTVQKVPITENHSLNAQSPYVATKIAADHLALSFYNSFDLPVTILRPFNTYGPRQSARAVIPTIISQLVNKNKFIKIKNFAITNSFFSRIIF
jgi:nucleoside-diphosphate-sugar epimerase